MSRLKNQQRVFDRKVFGLQIDNETRCAHYHGENDIIAIKFKCCGQWFACHACHSALAGHEAQVWPEMELDQRLLLCGGCGHELTALEYFACESKCPGCHRSFNPGCTRHYHLYFAR